jgi:hypothetical protein
VSEESEFAGVSLDLFVFGNEEVVEGSEDIGDLRVGGRVYRWRYRSVLIPPMYLTVGRHTFSNSKFLG